MKDGARHTLSYLFDGPHPYPVRRYVGTVRLEPITTSDATFVHWSGDFDADREVEQTTAETFRRAYLSFVHALADATARETLSRG
jgi:hypothetical protein